MCIWADTLKKVADMDPEERHALMELVREHWGEAHEIEQEAQGSFKFLKEANS